MLPDDPLYRGRLIIVSSLPGGPFQWEISFFLSIKGAFKAVIIGAGDAGEMYRELRDNPN
jgi:hypothetical protein